MSIAKLNRSSLTDQDKTALEILSKQIKTLWPEAKLILFGSHARGTADPESDVDIFIALPCPVTPQLRRQLVHLAFDINLIYNTNISIFVVSEDEWKKRPLNTISIFDTVRSEGIEL